jgi:L-rhamnose mutarotase
MKRMGRVLGDAPGRVAEYGRLRAAARPGVRERIAASGIRNVASRAPGEHRAAMEDVFHAD